MAASSSPKRPEGAADDRLERYRVKRDFAITPEPPGTEGAVSASSSTKATGRFVVQRHRASSLHYDLRLEAGGVLVSWAVPRGPSLDPSRRRLAVRVEDHPVSYFDFEGRIPEHQYGAGDVIVWDWGTYTAEPSMQDVLGAIADGELKFRLDGAKLKGAFVLLRTAGFGRRRVPATAALRQKWLLIHRRDDEAVEGWDAEDLPRSVKTGRTNAELAASTRKRR
jgi:bifunctional non-homologous end joining protein LigD